MQSRLVIEAGTTRFDSRANQRAFLIGSHAADFPLGPAAYGLHKQAGHMKATVRIASHKKALVHRGRPHMNQCCAPGCQKSFCNNICQPQTLRVVENSRPRRNLEGSNGVGNHQADNQSSRNATADALTFLSLVKRTARAIGTKIVRERSFGRWKPE
jgi:hypothetical protein